ncbi:tryptophan transporter [Bacillus testis]|uniref:tryptophan transporter n=1 Tax=Bacillus testis TaxID=1622072 RepID=UPI00067ECD98|nr:tryptophan transporter [Bacillus testis]
MNNTKTLVSLALFVGIGAILHAVIPPIFFGMKPDMMLTMMFLGILLFPQIKNVVLLGITTGIISALTSGFPGGAYANPVDKIVTAFVFFGMALIIKKMHYSIVTLGMITAVGTLVSGLVFLGTAYVIVGLPGPFLGLIGAVVLPAMALNTIAIVIMYPIVSGILRKSHIQVQTIK